jgi:hypothetical protein
MYKHLYWIWHYINWYSSYQRGRRDRMVVWFTTTYAISASEFESGSGDVYSIQHYVINFVSGLRQVGGFLRVLRFLHQ